MENREIEVKFLEIDKPKLIVKLNSLGASDLGEEVITEQIFYDKDLNWIKEHKFVRIRKTKKGTYITYKHTEDRTAVGTKEIEYMTAEADKVRAFLEELGLVMHREQEKKRHKFKLVDVIVDIDTWPSIPTYVELEGPDEEAIKEAANKLEFDYSKGVFGTAAHVIEEVYKINIIKKRLVLSEPAYGVLCRRVGTDRGLVCSYSSPPAFDNL
jgi:adenylate cyclase, class 2